MQKHLFANAKTRPKKIRKILAVLQKYYRMRAVNWSDPFHVLISCVLSQRTREENTEKAAHQLFQKAATPHAILKLPLQQLQKLIKPAGFYREKAKRIKKICKIIIEKYGGKVPQMRTELLELPGVGWKTSAVVLSYGLGKKIIAVDTHVNRCSKRLGLAGINAGVEQVRIQLEKVFPKKFWNIINLGFVNFGREVCRPINPKCKICELKRICKYYKNLKKEKLKI